MHSQSLKAPYIPNIKDKQDLSNIMNVSQELVDCNSENSKLDEAENDDYNYDWCKDF